MLFTEFFKNSSMVLSTSSPCIFIGCQSRLRWGYCRTSVKPGTGLMRWVRYLEGFHILRIPNVSKKFPTALPNPIVVLPSESSSLFTWGRSVEGLPVEAEHLPPHTCTKWQCRALRILLSGTAHLVSGGSYPQILQIWPVLSAEQNNGNFLHVSGWKLGKSSSLAWQPGGQLRWWIFLLSKPGCDSSSFAFQLWEIWLTLVQRGVELVASQRTMLFRGSKQQSCLCVKDCKCNTVEGPLWRPCWLLIPKGTWCFISSPVGWCLLQEKRGHFCGHVLLGCYHHITSLP